MPAERQVSPLQPDNPSAPGDLHFIWPGTDFNPYETDPLSLYRTTHTVSSTSQNPFALTIPKSLKPLGWEVHADMEEAGKT